jgi:hypothetical protein
VEKFHHWNSNVGSCWKRKRCENEKRVLCERVDMDEESSDVEVVGKGNQGTWKLGRSDDGDELPSITHSLIFIISISIQLIDFINSNKKYLYKNKI